MESHEIAGTIALGSSLVISCIGMPLQIIKTIKTGEKVSKILAGSTLFSYSSWAAYGYLKPDDFLFYSQSFGAAMSLAVVLQSIFTKTRGGIGRKN